MPKLKTTAIIFTILLCFASHTANANKPTINNINPPYKRIISLYPAHTENIAALGAEKYLIGISRSDNYPPSILNKPRFSARDGAERFLAARPDAVLIRPMLARAYPRLFDKLRSADITVISLQPQNKKTEKKNAALSEHLAALFSYWRTLAALVQCEGKGEKLIADFIEKIEKIEQRTKVLQQKESIPPPKVYFETMHNKSRTIAKGSIAAFVLEAAGGINIADDAVQVRSTNIAYYPKEKLLSKGEMVDIFIAQQGRMNAITKKSIITERGYMAIRAVREKKVYIVPEEIVSRPTLRIIEGVELLHTILYPSGSVENKESLE